MDLTESTCTAPWAVGSWSIPRRMPPWMPRWMQRTHMVYPDTLFSFNLSLNNGLVPPTNFAFPRRPRSLKVYDCGITDITRFRFPSPLVRLDVTLNNFSTLEENEWPEVQTLMISDALDQPLTETELEVLHRKIPGVRIDG